MNNQWWVEPKELDKDQREIISLNINGDYLVVGPPGSGKTNLLLLRANTYQLEQLSNLCILVFTRTLKEFLVSGASNYDFPPHKIKTYFNWAWDLFREYGYQHSRSEDFKDERGAILEGLKHLTSEYTLNRTYDAILLDEANDYHIEEINILKAISKRLFAVGDARQQIYHKENTLAHLRSIVSETKTLKFHYRNGLNICKLADRISKDQSPEAMLEPTCHYDEQDMKSTVKIFGGISIRQQCERILIELPDQMQVYQGEMIGIICPTRKFLPVIIEFFLNSPLAHFCTIQSSESGYMAFQNDRPICICTIHSAKGLEFRALHLVGADDINGAQNRAIAYTAVTRTKTSLRVYHEKPLISYLESAFAQFDRRTTPPTINEIFGKGK